MHQTLPIRQHRFTLQRVWSIDQAMGKVKFLALYLLVVLGTYLERPLMMGLAFDHTRDPKIIIALMYVGMFVLYGLLIFICYLRAKALKRMFWLVFPCLSALFDLLLVYFIFIPTIMNLLSLGFGFWLQPKATEYKPTHI
jgi:hypothetical protein